MFFNDIDTEQRRNFFRIIKRKYLISETLSKDTRRMTMSEKGHFY